jgi:hypothetical protein
MSWGNQPWGQTPWGGSLFVEPPAEIQVFFTALEPVENAVGVAQGTHVSFRIASGAGVLINSLAVSVGGINYIRTGQAQNGAIVSIVANDQQGYDIQIDLPDKLPLNTQQEVAISILSSTGQLALGSYVFTVGVGPRLLLVRNPQENVLLAQFNRAMRRDDNFHQPHNWVITPLGDAKPLQIVEVSGTAGLPDTALLRYQGGGSLYRLTVLNVLSQEGDPIEYGFNSVEFEIVFGDEEEPTIRLFNTIFGPIGLVQRVRSRRTMDAHVANRSLALGMDEVLRIKKQAFDNTLDRTGRIGKGRS